MNTLNFLNFIHLTSPKVIDRKENKILLSFQTELLLDGEENAKGELCFIFDLNSGKFQKWIHQEITFREGIPFLDPHFSSLVYHYLRTKNFDLSISYPLEEFLFAQCHKIKVITLLKWVDAFKINQNKISY